MTQHEKKSIQATPKQYRSNSHSLNHKAYSTQLRRGDVSTRRGLKLPATVSVREEAKVSKTERKRGDRQRQRAKQSDSKRDKAYTKSGLVHHQRD